MRTLRLCFASTPALVCLFAGCGDDIHLDAAHHQYVVSELRVPSNNTTAHADGLDLNGDKTVDNLMGQVFGVLGGQGLGVAETARESLLRGGLIMLADLETDAFDDSDISGFTTYLGSDPVPVPCLDPARLETCGQHLRGEGQFSVDPNSASDRAVGRIAEGEFSHSVGVLPVEIAIDVSTPIRLDLHGARVRLAQISEHHISGILAGGITEADIHGVVIPQATAQIERIVTTECSDPAGLPPCGCVHNSRADVLQRLFDTDHDCHVAVSEVANNGLAKSLLTPDITLDGQKLLSFGVGVELATATFTAP